MIADACPAHGLIGCLTCMEEIHAERAGRRITAPAPPLSEAEFERVAAFGLAMDEAITARTPEEVVAEALDKVNPAGLRDARIAVASLRSAGLLAEPVDGDAREALAQVYERENRNPDGEKWLNADQLDAARSQAWSFYLKLVDLAIAAGWRPPALVGDDAVERAARAMFEPAGTTGDYTWAEMVVEDQSRADLWRADARAVLEAAGVTFPAPVDESTDLPAASSGPDLHQVIDELRAQLEGETVTTVEELDALPVGSVVEDPFAAICVKERATGWVYDWHRSTSAVKRGGHDHPPYFPARVLFRPSTEGDDRG